MKRKWIKLVSVLLCAAMLVSLLCSCGGEEIDPAAFTDQALSARFTGESDDSYKELAGLDDKSAAAAFEQVLADQADYFAEYYDIDLNLCSDDVYQRIIELYRALLAKASYEVGASTASGDGYLVSVTITPLDIVSQVRDQDWAGFQEGWIADYADLYEMEEAEFEETWASRILDLFEARVNTTGYLESETISIQIARNGGDYTIYETDLQRIDTLVIKY